MSSKIQDVAASAYGESTYGREVLLHDPSKYGSDDGDSTHRFPVSAIITPPYPPLYDQAENTPLPYTYNNKQVYRMINEAERYIVPGSYGNMGMLNSGSNQIDKLLEMSIVYKTAPDGNGEAHFLGMDGSVTVDFNAVTTALHFVNNSTYTIVHILVSITYTRNY